MTHRYYDGRPFGRFDDPRSSVTTFLFTDRAAGAPWQAVPSFTDDDAALNGFDVDLQAIRETRDVRFLPDWGFERLRPCPYLRCLGERPVFPNFKGGTERTHCTRECWKGDDALRQREQQASTDAVFVEVRHLRTETQRLGDEVARLHAELEHARFAAEDSRRVCARLTADLAAAKACLAAIVAETAATDPALDVLSAPASETTT